MEDLVQLPGVGRKTANVLLGTWFGRPAIPVDTHVTRLSRRLGLTEEKDAVKIEFALQKLLPRGGLDLHLARADLARTSRVQGAQAGLRGVRADRPRLLPFPAANL